MSIYSSYTKEKTANETASAFKLLSDPTRIKIIATLLSTSKDICVGEIAKAVGVTHSATSHQLAKLEAAGVVSPRREGQTVCYVLNDNRTTRNLRAAINIFT